MDDDGVMMCRAMEIRWRLKDLAHKRAMEASKFNPETWWNSVEILFTSIVPPWATRK